MLASNGYFFSWCSGLVNRSATNIFSICSSYLLLLLVPIYYYCYSYSYCTTPTPTFTATTTTVGVAACSLLKDMYALSQVKLQC